MDSVAARGGPISCIGIRLGLVLLVSLLGSCAFENEGRSDEAEETVRRYLAAVAGADEVRGWSMLSASMQESTVTRESYIEVGFYQFAVTTAAPIRAAYAELLFRTRWAESTIGCPTGLRSSRSR